MDHSLGSQLTSQVIGPIHGVRRKSQSHVTLIVLFSNYFLYNSIAGKYGVFITEGIHHESE